MSKKPKVDEVMFAQAVQLACAHIQREDRGGIRSEDWLRGNVAMAYQALRDAREEAQDIETREAELD